jgi:hypothetical protein
MLKIFELDYCPRRKIIILKCKSNWFFLLFLFLSFHTLDKMDWMFSLNSPIR